MSFQLVHSALKAFGISDKEFCTMAKFGADNLGIPETTTIIFSFEDIEEDCTGFAHNYECDENEYQIVLNPSAIRSWEEMIKTLFHELTHIKQYVNQELSGSTWKGVYYDPIAPNDIGYCDLPWEREAFVKEEYLYQKYVQGV